LLVIIGGESLVSHAGGTLLVETARRSGLARELSTRLGPWRLPLAIHDPGKIVLDLAVAVALGGDAACDVGVLRAQPGVFGAVASDPTVSRLIARLAEDPDGALAAITSARAVARERVWNWATTTGCGSPGSSPTPPAGNSLISSCGIVATPAPGDRIRNGKDTGLANLPYHDMAQNRIWLAIAALAQDLLAWTARLALPASVATYEPKRLRLRILAVAGRIVRAARRRILKIDPAWPWADVITTAHPRLMALPSP